MTERCSYSDLPAGTCWHCDPTPRAHTRDIPKPFENIALTIATQPFNPPRISGRALPEDTAHYDLHDYISALCDHTINSQQRELTHHNRDGSIATTVTRHITTNPPLITQLWEAAEGSRGLDTGNKAFGSQPAASLEALDVANDIDQGVHYSLKHTHGETHSHDLYPETIHAVRHLGTIATQHDAHMIRRWWSMARVITGWDLPSWRPDNTCPLCAKRGTLRVNYPTAFCVDCRSHWDHETIGLLVEHVRSENREDEQDTEDDTTVQAS